jgi:hypothetical protein
VIIVESAERIDATQLRLLFAALSLDFARISVSLPRMAVFDRAEDIWLVDTQADTSPLPDVSEGDDPDQFVVAAGGDLFAVDRYDLTALAIELASRLQKLAIGESGHAWPEVYRNGVFSGVAKPSADSSGRPAWRIEPGLFVPFGKLGTIGGVV